MKILISTLLSLFIFVGASCGQNVTFSDLASCEDAYNQLQAIATDNEELAGMINRNLDKIEDMDSSSAGYHIALVLMVSFLLCCGGCYANEARK